MQSPAVAQVAQSICLSVHSRLYFPVNFCTSSFSSTQVPSASTAEHVFSSMTAAAASSTMGEAWVAMPIKVMSAMALIVMVGLVY